MKVLLVNKFHWMKGGSETYYFELGKLLEEHGHEVAYFSMENEKNIKTGNKEYFVREIDMNSKDVTKALNVIYSRENKKIMGKALDEFKPDIVHVNNFQRQLTASIIDAAKERNIPIIYTSHDLQSVCPASAMLCQGKVCEKCLKSTKLYCIKNKCIKGSYLKSILSTIESIKYKKDKVYEKFDLIISPSSFTGNKIKSGGVNTKIITIPNFVKSNVIGKHKVKDGDYIFYFGRLSIEKGILNLLKAFAKQKQGYLYIAGDGPEKNNIIQYIKENKLEKRVKLLGFLKHDQIEEYIANCSFVVVPSICYENCPYSIIETYAIGKPVVGAKIGGIPELIIEGENGFLYKYDDIEELSKIIKDMYSNEKLRLNMGKKSLMLAKEKYSEEEFYKKIIDAYNNVVGEKNVNKSNE